MNDLFAVVQFICNGTCTVWLFCFVTVLVGLGVRYSLRVKDVDEFRKYKSQYTSKFLYLSITKTCLDFPYVVIFFFFGGGGVKA